MGIETTDLWKLVLERAELTPESEMLVDEQGRRLTFLEYKIASQQMAAGLYELGVKEGDVVTWVQHDDAVHDGTEDCVEF